MKRTFARHRERAKDGRVRGGVSTSVGRGNEAKPGRVGALPKGQRRAKPTSLAVRNAFESRCKTVIWDAPVPYGGLPSHLRNSPTSLVADYPDISFSTLAIYPHGWVLKASQGCP